MTCPLCKTQMKAEVELTGGCGGHYGEDDRCYCDSADVHLEFACPNHVAHIWDGKRTVKNKNFCKQPNLMVGELSDQASMARWFTSNYTPGENANIFEKKDRW